MWEIAKRGQATPFEGQLTVHTAPARKSERFFHYLILMVVTRRARGTESMADWQLYKHLTAIHSHSESCVCLALGCPVTCLPVHYLSSSVPARRAMFQCVFVDVWFTLMSNSLAEDLYSFHWCVCSISQNRQHLFAGCLLSQWTKWLLFGTLHNTKWLTNGNLSWLWMNKFQWNNTEVCCLNFTKPTPSNRVK